MKGGPQKIEATMRSAHLKLLTEGKIKWMERKYLPFMVLKPFFTTEYTFSFSLYCNSAYRLRYATKGARQQRSEATMRSAHL